MVTTPSATNFAFNSQPFEHSRSDQWFAKDLSFDSFFRSVPIHMNFDNSHLDITSVGKKPRLQSLGNKLQLLNILR